MDEQVDPELALLSFDPEPTEESAAPFDRNLLRAVADLVLSTTYDGIWLVDTEARTTFVNERTAQMLGYSVEEMLRLPLGQFMDDKGRQITECNLNRLQHGVREYHEFKCIRKDGTPIWLLVSSNPVYDRAGRYAGALAMIADLSVQKARERTLLVEMAELDNKLDKVSALQSSLHALVYKDPLTGLASRQHFDDRLAQEMARCRRHGTRLCLLFFDIDGVKRINHRHGHSAGDDIFRSIGRSLGGVGGRDGTAVLRESDIAARYSGDQMVVLALETDFEGGQRLAERILDRLRGTHVPVAEGVTVAPDVSIGVASCPFHAIVPADLIAAAARAMIRAKAEGGGRACLAEPLSPDKFG